MNFKLGKKEFIKDERDLMMAKYVQRIALPVIPPVSLPYKFFSGDWGMLANDEIGDCVFAGAGHEHMLWESEAGNQIVFPVQNVIKAYSDVTGYTSSNPDSDQGTNVRLALNYRRNIGIFDSNNQAHKLDSYLQIQSKDIQEMKTALFLFDAVGIGINFPSTAMAQFQNGQPWDIVPGSPIEGGHYVPCFSGDTKISLLDGREITIKQALKEFKGKEFWVYSCNEKGKIVPGKAHSIRKTGVNKKLLRITLDDGEVIKCTPNHKFLTRNGTYKEARYLVLNESLMPLYRKISEDKKMPGYEMVLQPNKKKWQYTHRLSVCEGKYYGKRMVVHHIDFNKRNNNPDNLKLMTWEEHTNLHQKDTIKLNEYAKSNRGRSKSQEVMIKNWSDPQFIENVKRGVGESGKRVTERLKKEGRCGFQIIKNPELHRLNGMKFGRINVKFANTSEAIKKRNLTMKDKFENDADFRKMKRHVAIKNLEKYNNKKIPVTDAQRIARRGNAIKLNQRRWNNLELEPVPNNHKIRLIEECGNEDVYDFTVDEYHNFALSSGVFVHNCVGYDENFIYVVTWGQIQRMTYAFYNQYNDEAWAMLSQDFLKNGKSPDGFDFETLKQDLVSLR